MFNNDRSTEAKSSLDRKTAEIMNIVQLNEPSWCHVCNREAKAQKLTVKSDISFENDVYEFSKYFMSVIVSTKYPSA